MKKRAKEYDKSMQLKEGIEFKDLIKVSLQKPIVREKPKPKKKK